MYKLTFFVLPFLLIASMSFAQTTVLRGGEISGSQTWQGIIRIQGDVIIPAGSRLTIEPGTQILLDASRDLTKGGSDKTRCEIIVRGSLSARGETNNKILFSSSASNPRMSDWYGIQFLHSKVENVIDYCIIEYGYNGITLKNTNLIVSNSEIRYNYNAGIRTEVKAKPNLNQNIISENGYAGVICELGAAPILTENLITGSPMGIVILSLSQPNIGSISRDENYNPGKNQFLNNEEYDIYNHSNKPILAQNNTWGNEDDAAIAAKIYDSEDNNKYGTIEYQPVFNARARQSTLNRFMILAQDTDTQSQNAQPAFNQDQPDTQGLQNQQDIPITQQSNIIQQIDSTMEKVFENQSQTTATPLIASTKIAEPISSGGGNSRAAEVEQIDYGRVFLEPFLDSRRKKLLHAEAIQVTSSLKNVMSSGTIRVKVVVNQQGLVESAIILRGINDILDETVLISVRKNVYEIGTVNGIPVRFSTNEVFRFQK